jgi:thiamine biosynthesis lipoprotein ApbE
VGAHVAQVDTPRGASISTSTVPRNSFHVRGRIITAIIKEPTASARAHPVSQITAAARTATEPSAWLTTSRRAARVFKFLP